jgi:hypothetical protein
MNDTLNIAWDSLRIEGESIFIEASDGAGIMAIIPCRTLDKAGERTLHAHVERLGGMRGWLERAIRARHSADRANGRIQQRMNGGTYLMTVRAEDFTGS